MEIGDYYNVGGRAERPTDMTLNSQKFSETFSFLLPTFDSQAGITANDYLYD
jgi:hypothetical protein